MSCLLPSTITGHVFKVVCLYCLYLFGEPNMKVQRRLASLGDVYVIVDNQMMPSLLAWAVIAA